MEHELQLRISYLPNYNNDLRYFFHSIVKAANFKIVIIKIKKIFHGSLKHENQEKKF